MSQSTMTPLQIRLLCDMTRQAATWKASAARGKWDCDMEGCSATKNGEVRRAREAAAAAGGIVTCFSSPNCRNRCCPNRCHVNLESQRSTRRHFSCILQAK